MKKANNILLLVGISLYIINAFLQFFRTAPSIKEGLSSYLVTGALIITLSTLLFVAFPLILLVLNLKDKYSKAFTNFHPFVTKNDMWIVEFVNIKSSSFIG